jgi:hypothetical protein
MKKLKKWYDDLDVYKENIRVQDGYESESERGKDTKKDGLME